ncbi:MAG: amino acid permease [Candidatus Marinimicrobia bacterium]|nr:amino acid permease [Candidatus Neomarinimicrobiota bacterium]
MKTETTATGRPVPIFSILSAAAVVVGIVVGIGIFRLPPIVAANSANGVQFLLFWVAGGAISILGALCYAELAASYPDAGGEYHFLSRAYGPSVGFLFSWGRMTVIQTGSIALAGFILGDYASLILNLGPASSSIYAGLTVVMLTGLNVWGTNPSRKTQNVMTAAIVIILLITTGVGFGINAGTPPITNMGQSGSGGGAAGAAMIFVLLTYGGWNEAAYLSAELKDVKKNMIRVLILGLGLITLLYLMVNYAYLHVLGLEGLRNSDTVGAELIERLFGPIGAHVMAITVIFTALSTMNATIITGARTNYALGRDFPLLGFLGKWNKDQNTPINAHLVQGSIAMILVILGGFTQQGVNTMVEYTAPVFWLFLLLTVASLFVFRIKKAKPEGSFQVPLYPITPILFIIAAGYMLYSSLTYTGIGALAGAGILLVGVPLLLAARGGYSGQNS